MAAQRCFRNNLHLVGSPSLHQHDEVQTALQSAASHASRSVTSPSVYIGTAGQAFALHQISKRKTATATLSFNAKGASIDLLKQSLHAYSAEPTKPQSVYIGSAGAYLVASLIYADDGYLDAAKQYAEMYKAPVMLQSALDANEDEVLFGRAGYLLGLLQVEAYAGVDISAEATQVVQRMIDSGKAGTQLLRSKQNELPPLFYAWNYSFYVGAAHGLFGIAFSLLKARRFWPDSSVASDVFSLVDWLLDCECDAGGVPGKGGHFPTKVYPKVHPLVHWCHGAPGAIFTFSEAYAASERQAYFDATMRAAQVVWTYGLLNKGPGLCHGISGNAYALAKAHAAAASTRNTSMSWLREAPIRFVEFASHGDGRTTWANPDNPASLYEGVAGFAQLSASILEGEATSALKMPLFDI